MSNPANLKSLGYTCKRIANLLGVVLCDIEFCGFFDVTFDLHISSTGPFVVDHVAKLLFASNAKAHLFFGRLCCKTSIICIKCWSRWFISTNPKKLSTFTSPPSTSLGNSLPNSCVKDGCWFSSISPFVMFSKSINNSLSLFLGHSHYFLFKSNAVATGCLCWLSEYNDCVAGLCCVFTFNFISKQPKMESRKTPHVK